MKVFLSATGLVWCGFFSLIMIGVIYFLKKDKSKDSDHLKKTFIFLYCVTILSIISELLLQNALAVSEVHPIYSTVLSRLYIFLGMLWNAVVIVYYTMLYRKCREKEFNYEYSRRLNTIIFSIVAIISTLVITLPLTSFIGKTIQINGQIIAHTVTAVFAKSNFLLKVTKDRKSVV